MVQYFNNPFLILNFLLLLIKKLLVSVQTFQSLDLQHKNQIQCAQFSVNCMPKVVVYVCPVLFITGPIYFGGNHLWIINIVHDPFKNFFSNLNLIEWSCVHTFFRIYKYPFENFTMLTRLFDNTLFSRNLNLNRKRNMALKNQGLVLCLKFP